MKKIIVFMFFVAFIVQLCPAAFTTSIDDQSTYKNAYRWTGHPRADKILLWAQEVEDRINGTSATEQLVFTATDTPTGTTAGTLYYDLSLGKFVYRNGSAAWVTIEAGTSGNSLDGAYDVGPTISADNGSVTITASNAADNAALALVQEDAGSTVGATITSAGTGALLSFDSNGTGADVLGSDSTWNVSKAGVGTFVGLVSSTGDVTLTGAATDIIHDASASQLEFQDSSLLVFGTDDDISIAYDGSGDDLNILFDDKEIAFGASGAGGDVFFHMETASTWAKFSEANDQLELELADLHLSSDSQIEIEDDAGGVDWTIDNATDETLLFYPTETTDDQSINLGNATNTTDLRIFGATASTVIFDASADNVLFNAYDIQLQDDDVLAFGDGKDIIISQSSANLLTIGQTVAGTGSIAVGANDAGLDVKMFGDTASAYWLWDTSEDTMTVVGGNATITTDDAEADQIKLNAAGTIADASGHAIVLTTTNGGILLDANTAANGDVELDAADDVIITAAAAVTITNGEALTISGDATVTGTLTAVGAYVNPFEIVAATNSIEITESGTVFILNHATEFATTLPTVASSAGVTYRFIVGAAPADADYTIVTDSGEDKISGLVVVNGAAVEATTDDTITFTRAAAAVGDWCELTSDGVLWYISGQAVAATAITCTGT